MQIRYYPLQNYILSIVKRGKMPLPCLPYKCPFILDLTAHGCCSNLIESFLLDHAWSLSLDSQSKLIAIHRQSYSRVIIYNSRSVTVLRISPIRGGVGDTWAIYCKLRVQIRQEIPWKAEELLNLCRKIRPKGNFISSSQSVLTNT